MRKQRLHEENDQMRDLNFGFQLAGTEITIKVYDEDSGFEFGDDLIAEVTVNSIYCSEFTAITQQTISADDSKWKMSMQSLCVEEIWIPLTSDGECTSSNGTSAETRRATNRRHHDHGHARPFVHLHAQSRLPVLVGRVQWRHFAKSTTPEFVLDFLSFFYIFLPLAVAFGTDANDTIRVPAAGQKWPLWIFGVLAFIVVLFVGLSLVTSRAFFLQKEQLLSEYATKVYLFVRAFKLPFMLAAASEVLVICSGMFVYASTQSSFILVTSVFGPLILMLSLAVYAQWRKNDYRLVIWPPEDDEEDILDEDEDFDAEDALEKEAEIMRETFVLPPLKGKGNTSIYDSADETFKMPSLPPKNVLQDKFAPGTKPMGIKSPAVMANKLGSTPAFRKSMLHSRKQAQSKEALNEDLPSQPSNSSGGGDLTIVPGGGPTEADTGAPNAPLAMKKKTPARRLGLLRDLLARRIGLRTLFSKQARRRYKEVDNLSPSNSAGSPAEAPQNHS